MCTLEIMSESDKSRREKSGLVGFGQSHQALTRLSQRKSKSHQFSSVQTMGRIKAVTMELLTQEAASCWARRHTGSRCEEPALMCSGVRGQASACGPASPGQKWVNCGQYRKRFATAETGEQLRWRNSATRHGYIQGKFLPQASSVLLLGFHGVEEGKFDDIGPDSRAGTPAQTAAQMTKGDTRTRSGMLRQRQPTCEQCSRGR